MIGTLRRLMIIKRKTLEEKLGMLANELMGVIEWYRVFIKNESEQENPIPLKEEFMAETLDKWISESSSDENLNTDPVKLITKEFDGLNVSYKVESKEIPRLPAGKLLKGKIFDNWHTNFLAKMSQARINDILDENFVRPDTKDKDYPIFKMNLDYLKYYLLTETINSNASSFIKPKMMDGI